jgi:hypothetical protein
MLRKARIGVLGGSHYQQVVVTSEGDLQFDLKHLVELQGEWSIRR